MKKIKKLKLALVVIIVLIVLIALAETSDLFNKKQIGISLPGLQNKVFLAAAQGDQGIEAIIYNPGEDKVERKSQIKTLYSLGSCSPYNCSGSNFSVQYNPKTDEIFYATEGIGSSPSPESIGKCGKKDGSPDDPACDSYLYCTNFSGTRHERLYSFDGFEGSAGNWILSPKNNSIYIFQRASFSNSSEGDLIKLNLLDKSVKKITSNVCNKGNNCSYINYGDLTISYQEDYLYRAFNMKRADREEILYLDKINLATDKVETLEIFRTNDSFYFETLISPDQKYFVFYNGQFNPQREIILYDLTAGKVADIFPRKEVGNFNMFWWGDSKKYLYEQTLYAYDIATKKRGESEIEKLGADAMNWLPFKNPFIFLVYAFNVPGEEGSIQFYDVIKKRNFIPSDEFFQSLGVYNFGGINWF